MRVQVNLSDEMVKMVDSYAKKMGVSRSAFCSMMVGQGVMNLDKAYNLFDNLGVKLSEDILKDFGSDLKQ